MTKKTDKSNWGSNTVLAHAGNNPQDYFGFVNPPVVHASTVLFPDSATMAGRNQKYTYAIHGTPTSDALSEAVDALEGSAGTIIVPSGLAAVTIPLLAFLKTGDHMLMVDSVYHPTRRFCDTMLRDIGIEVTYYDPLMGADVKSLIQTNTRVVFTESPGSNTFEIQDIPAISKVAHDHGAVVMMDNTWATPLYFKALDFGVDLSIHAATKYPGGHSDVMLGLVSANAQNLARLKETQMLLGVCGSPDDSYQILRGMRTMGVRLEQHGKSALEIAQALNGMPGVARVLHPALPDFPGHALWKRDFKGSSGLFSIVLDGGPDQAKWVGKAHAFLDALEIFGLGYSWGGYESLAVHAHLDDRTIAKKPSEGPVMRLQIGLEDSADLLQDLRGAITAANEIT